TAAAPVSSQVHTKPKANPAGTASATSGDQISLAARQAFTDGMNALQQRDLQKAKASFEKAVKLAPRNPESQNALGFVLMSLGDYAGAEKVLTAVLKLNPKLQPAQINLAQSLAQLGELAASAEAFHRALELG